MEAKAVKLGLQHKALRAWGSPLVVYSGQKNPRKNKHNESEYDGCYSLFQIVCRISKKPWVDTALNSIKTLDDHTIPIGMKEFVIQNFSPDTMQELSAAMREDLLFLSVPL